MQENNVLCLLEGFYGLKDDLDCLHYGKLHNNEYTAHTPNIKHLV